MNADNPFPITFPSVEKALEAVGSKIYGAKIIIKPTMNADTITTARLADFKALLQAAVDTVSRLHIQSVSGNISTQDAAAIVRETAETISQFCKD